LEITDPQILLASGRDVPKADSGKVLKYECIRYSVDYLSKVFALLKLIKDDLIHPNGQDLQVQIRRRKTEEREMPIACQ
jgi:hypothetical protein